LPELHPQWDTHGSSDEALDAGLFGKGQGSGSG
jgi:hypothetical protein